MHSSDQAETAAEMFGLLLRHFRERAGLSQEQSGRRIGYSKSQVAMVERGARPPKGVFVQRADEVPGAQGALIVAAPKPPKQTKQRNPLPGWFTPFAEEEGKAWARHEYENHVMPGLLQTEAYARAVLTGQYPPSTTTRSKRRSPHASNDRSCCPAGRCRTSVSSWRWSC